jgi:hypothetical protein
MNLTPSKRERVTLRQVLGGVVLAAIGWAAYHQACTTSEQPQLPRVSQMTGLDVTADTLYRAYAENEIAADRDYKNKVLAVSGTISSIGAGSQYAGPVVTLRVGNTEMAVICNLDHGQENAAAALKAGQKVIIKGRCQGVGATAVIIQDGLIQPN